MLARPFLGTHNAHIHATHSRLCHEHTLTDTERTQLSSHLSDLLLERYKWLRFSDTETCNDDDLRCDPELGPADLHRRS